MCKFFAVKVVPTDAEKKLINLGCDVVYSSNKIMPVDLKKARELVAEKLGEDVGGVELEEVVGDGIINRVFLVRRRDDEKGKEGERGECGDGRREKGGR